MIKPYIGEGWFYDDNGVETECVYTEADGMIQAVCDICGDNVCDDEGEGGNVFESENEAYNTAQDYDWLVIGKHHICPSCKDKIERGEIDIKINIREGSNNEGK